MAPATLKTTDDLLICTACGTQYDVALPPTHPLLTAKDHPDHIPASATDPGLPLSSCRVCDDPRQFVPPEGQSFTTLGLLRNSASRYKNVFRRCEGVERNVIEVWTEPKIGIGQRACIIQTPHGNIMWDCIAYLDQDTVNQINELGGLKFIIISHPHFYTTWADWSTTFSCPVYMSSRDAAEWANRRPGTPTHPQTTTLNLIRETHTELLPGVTAIIAGGHFPGSMMLHTAVPNTSVPSLFVADTIMAVPSAHNPAVPAVGSGVVSYSFMWSIPNMIPLDPDTIRRIWEVIKDEKFEFAASYGVMAGVSNVRAKETENGLRWRVLESIKMFLKMSGRADHPLLQEQL